MSYSLEFDERVPYHEFHKLLDKGQLIPDWWRENVEEALELHDYRHIWRVKHGDETVGWLWVEGLIPGRGAILGAVVESDHRRLWHRDLLLSVREIVYWLMKDHDLRRMVVLVRKGRMWSEMFFRKRLGFQFEGYARDAFSYRGKDYPLVQLSLTKSDIEKVGEDYAQSAAGFRVGDRAHGTPWPRFEPEAATAAAGSGERGDGA